MATYAGKFRNPVLFDHSVFAEAVVDDVGARGWLRTHPDLVTPVACDGTGNRFDVDTLDHLDAFLKENR